MSKTFLEDVNLSNEIEIVSPILSCADGDNDLLFLYNEIPLQIPGCDANGVCKQSLIIERLGHWLDADCMEIFCSNS